MSSSCWDPQNIWFAKASQTVEEEIFRTVGAVLLIEDPNNEAMDGVFDNRKHFKKKHCKL
jgi:hypothetical protein